MLFLIVLFGLLYLYRAFAISYFDIFILHLTRKFDKFPKVTKKALFYLYFIEISNLLEYSLF
jgi:hypothetical protein